MQVSHLGPTTIKVQHLLLTSLPELPPSRPVTLVVDAVLSTG